MRKVQSIIGSVRVVPTALNRKDYLQAKSLSTSLRNSFSASVVLRYWPLSQCSFMRTRIRWIARRQAALLFALS
jgi:hypothetical protein